MEFDLKKEKKISGKQSKFQKAVSGISGPKYKVNLKIFAFFGIDTL